MFGDDDTPKKTKAFEVGQNLDDMSVDELDAAVSQLEAEIARLKEMRKIKSAHLNAAEALFSTKK